MLFVQFYNSQATSFGTSGICKQKIIWDNTKPLSITISSTSVRFLILNTLNIDNYIEKSSMVLIVLLPKSMHFMHKLLL